MPLPISFDEHFVIQEGQCELEQIYTVSQGKEVMYFICKREAAICYLI